jgi:DNA-binding NtrC family response regulator
MSGRRSRALGERRSGLVRVLLLLETHGADAQKLHDALAVRGHLVSRGSAQLALEDPAGSELSRADLIVAESAIVARANLVQSLAAVSPGIEFVLVGATPGNVLPADVIAQVESTSELDRLLEVVDEVADILDGERLREPTDLVAYETLFAGDSPLILNLVRRVRLVARSDAPVWISGDDGSGRMIIARAIHERSSRRRNPFIAVNMGAYADDELAHLLFEGDQAAVARAEAGTLFLEQISRAGPQTQRALVQFLDARQSADKQRILARLIAGIQFADLAASAPRPLASELYYHLKVLEVEIPRLVDRARDLEQIVGRMLERLSHDRKPPAVSAQTIKLLEQYSFPGNMLELAHALTHAYVVAHGGSIEPHHLPPSIRQAEESARVDSELQSLDTVAKRFERDYLLRVLRSVGGSRSRTAEILGISRKGLWAKLKGHGISDEDIEAADDEFGPDTSPQ